MEQKTKKNLWYVGGALLLIFLVAIYFYYRGKSQITIAPLPIDDPAHPAGNTGGASDSEISRIATDLHTDMSGAAWNGHDNEPWKNSLALSDTDFTKLYNFFNTKYQSEHDSTLTGWVNDEQAWTDFTWYELRNAVLKRLGKLNLK